MVLTAPGNAASRAVTQRLGMEHDPEGDFDRPRSPAEHALRHHVLYRVLRPRPGIPTGYCSRFDKEIA